MPLAILPITGDTRTLSDGNEEDEDDEDDAYYPWVFNGDYSLLLDLY